jgi:hypothetical protein
MQLSEFFRMATTTAASNNAPAAHRAVTAGFMAHFLDSNASAFADSISREIDKDGEIYLCVSNANNNKFMTRRNDIDVFARRAFDPGEFVSFEEAGAMLWVGYQFQVEQFQFELFGDGKWVAVGEVFTSLGIEMPATDYLTDIINTLSRPRS